MSFLQFFEEFKYNGPRQQKLCSKGILLIQFSIHHLAGVSVLVHVNVLCVLTPLSTVLYTSVVYQNKASMWNSKCVYLREWGGGGGGVLCVYACVCLCACVCVCA